MIYVYAHLYPCAPRPGALPAPSAKRRSWSSSRRRSPASSVYAHVLALCALVSVVARERVSGLEGGLHGTECGDAEEVDAVGTAAARIISHVPELRLPQSVGTPPLGHRRIGALLVPWFVDDDPRVQITPVRLSLFTFYRIKLARKLSFDNLSPLLLLLSDI